MRGLDWRAVPEDERWLWWECIWLDARDLQERYELPVRCGWWEHSTQLEALAALAAWVSAYDTGEWDDPSGKVSLLLDLERVAAVLRDGNEPFHPERDRAAFERHLERIGCAPPTSL